MTAPKTIKRLQLNESQRALIEEIRSQVKEWAYDDDNSTEYVDGVVDALAFVWAGMPEDAYELYRATMSQFAGVMHSVEETLKGLEES